MYCNIDDIKQLIPEGELIDLSDDENAGEVNSNVVNSAIEAAEEFINGHLRVRYSLPFDTVPPTIKSIAVQIARYNLYQRRFADGMPEGIANNYKDNCKTLEKIRDGGFDLGIASASQDEPAHEKQRFVSNKTSDDRYFNDSLRNAF